MRLYTWKPADGLNLGDWLSVPILRALGHEPEPPEPGQPCLFAVGSLLSPTHYQASGASRIIVWGSGAGAADRAGFDLDFRAVRGPRTRDLLGLPADIPLGDPALLLPELVTLPAVAPCRVLYVNHCGTVPIRRPAWADGVLGMVTTEADGLAKVARIARAGFVATAALHGAVIAQAYGVPWAPCSVVPQVPSFKWSCWLAYLGLPELERFPADLAEARAWWERTGRRGRTGDLGALREAGLTLFAAPARSLLR